MAHRFSYMLAYGQITPNDVVMHSCDNPICVNPSHLKIGTTLDNVKDRDRKGRLCSILKPSDIPDIRDSLRRGICAAEIAAVYGVKPATIQNIAAGRTWAWVPETLAEAQKEYARG
jgi:hypothetical protein